MSQFENIKAIIFDYGGTLDTGARHWANVLWEGFCQASVPVSEAQFREVYVFAERALAKSPIICPEDNFHTLLLKKVNIETEELVRQNHWSPSETERQSAVKAIADYCNNYAVKTLETSREVLKKLKKQYKLVLVSNFYGNIETILKDFKLEYFENVIESAVVGVRKPDPEIYRMGVRATGFPAEETAVVGDSYGKDIIPAKAVGCKAIWMKGESWAPEETDETLPDAIVENITQVADLFVRQ